MVFESAVSQTHCFKSNFYMPGTNRIQQNMFINKKNLRPALASTDYLHHFEKEKKKNNIYKKLDVVGPVDNRPSTD